MKNLMTEQGLTFILLEGTTQARLFGNKQVVIPMQDLSTFVNEGLTVMISSPPVQNGTK